MYSFRVGNLIRHKSGGPIMTVEYVHKLGLGLPPVLDCVWVESRQRKFSSFPGDMVEAVYADGSPREYSKE